MDYTSEIERDFHKLLKYGSRDILPIIKDPIMWSDEQIYEAITNPDLLKELKTENITVTRQNREIPRMRAVVEEAQSRGLRRKIPALLSEDEKGWFALVYLYSGDQNFSPNDYKILGFARNFAEAKMVRDRVVKYFEENFEYPWKETKTGEYKMFERGILADPDGEVGDEVAKRWRDLRYDKSGQKDRKTIADGEIFITKTKNAPHSQKSIIQGAWPTGENIDSCKEFDKGNISEGKSLVGGNPFARKQIFDEIIDSSIEKIESQKKVRSNPIDQITPEQWEEIEKQKNDPTKPLRRPKYHQPEKTHKRMKKWKMPADDDQWVTAFINLHLTKKAESAIILNEEILNNCDELYNQLVKRAEKSDDVYALVARMVDHIIPTKNIPSMKIDRYAAERGLISAKIALRRDPELKPYVEKLANSLSIDLNSLGEKLQANDGGIKS